MDGARLSAGIELGQIAKRACVNRRSSNAGSRISCEEWHVSMDSILWLEELSQSHCPQVGAKALHLASILRAGMPVPTGFCITATAYDEFMRANGLQAQVRAVVTAVQHERQALALRLQDAIESGCLSQPLRIGIVRAYQKLAASEGGARWPVAVRSSASAEDLPAASFAGQQLTVLNVRDEHRLLQAIRECWASLWSPQAVLYRAARDLDTPPVMAVLVQRMVDAEAAGVAFSVDAVSGSEQVVIEATFGLGETVVGGEGDVDRYVASRETGAEAAPPLVAHKIHMRSMAAQGGVQTADVPAQMQDARVLTSQQVQHIAETVLRLEELLGRPQDMEWAWSQGQMSVLQSRPVTTSASGFFTEVGHDDQAMWTAGFVNERFPSPVSPLGWSLVRELLEELAFRDPLRYLGVRQVERIAITRLYQGHPYVNVFVFQTLYKAFPAWLLPQDACRYFPQGDTSSRLQVPYPRSALDPRFLVSMLRHFLRHADLWSPWHNFRVWAFFAAEHESRSRELEARFRALQANTATLADTWAVIEDAQALNARLLAIHRWSLTCADLGYSLLRRILVRSAGTEDAMDLAAALVTGLPNRSKEVNDALQALAQARETPEFARLLDDFLWRYGHRSFSLDIYHPSFREEPKQVLDLLAGLGTAASSIHSAARGRERARDDALRMLSGDPLGWLRRAVFNHVLGLTQRYIPLREEQRFLWQKTLALQRGLFLLLARRMVAAGVLAAPHQVFFLTKEELHDCVRDCTAGQSHAALVAVRERQFGRLCQEHEIDPAPSYPAFLRGDQPLETGRPLQEFQFRGRPVSPGLARGRVVVLHSPQGLASIRPGDVLVTRSVDPGWTPVFGLLGALVLECGGQLSHGAVVAREYGLPTVAGIPGIMQRLHDGDLVVVDGRSGVVTKVVEP